MPQEIERKFLVTSDRWREETRDDPVELVQGYLHVDRDSEIRVRLRGADEALLTVKRGGRSEARVEVEVRIGRDEAQRLLDTAAIGVILTKRRHLVDLSVVEGQPPLVAEIDEFAEPHEGLVVAEVELPGPDTPLPDVDWLGEEVTGDPRYYNATLATEQLD